MKCNPNSTLAAMRREKLISTKYWTKHTFGQKNSTGTLWYRAKPCMLWFYHWRALYRDYLKKEYEFPGFSQDCYDSFWEGVCCEGEGSYKGKSIHSFFLSFLSSPFLVILPPTRWKARVWWELISFSVERFLAADMEKAAVGPLGQLVVWLRSEPVCLVS